MSHWERFRSEPATQRDIEYHRELAKRILKDEIGIIVSTNHEWQYFHYMAPGVCIVFYPHKTKGTGNRHVRVRDQNSRFPDEARRIMDKLFSQSGDSLTFKRKT